MRPYIEVELLTCLDTYGKMISKAARDPSYSVSERAVEIALMCKRMLELVEEFEVEKKT